MLAVWGASPASWGLFDTPAFGLSAVDGEEMLRERIEREREREGERGGGSSTAATFLHLCHSSDRDTVLLGP